MLRRYFYGIAACGLCALAISSVEANEDCLARGMMSGEGNPHMMMAGKDAEWRQELMLMHLEMRKEIIKLEAELEIAEIELEQHKIEGDVDYDVLIDDVKKINDIREDVDLVNLKFEEDVREMLSPEEFEMWRMAMKRGMMKKCMKKGTMPHGGDEERPPPRHENGDDEEVWMNKRW